jgi:hypothetical protein
MSAPRYPLNDRLPCPPTDWADIKLGPGQQANAYGHDGSWQWDTSADAGTTVDPDSVRRNGEPIIFISRVPERW